MPGSRCPNRYSPSTQILDLSWGVPFFFACTWGLDLEVLPCVEGLYHVTLAKCEMIAGSLCGTQNCRTTSMRSCCIRLCSGSTNFSRRQQGAIGYDKSGLWQSWSICSFVEVLLHICYFSVMTSICSGHVIILYNYSFWSECWFHSVRLLCVSFNFIRHYSCSFVQFHCQMKQPFLVRLLYLSGGHLPGGRRVLFGWVNLIKFRVPCESALMD
jgi:hypothetical protein